MEPINPNLQEDNGYAPAYLFMYDFMHLLPVVEGGREEERVRLLGDPWSIRKRLTESDVGGRCSLIVFTDMVRQHILPQWNHELVTELTNGGRVNVNVYDRDMGSTHELVSRRCPRTQSFLFCCGWRRNFVRRRGLKEGDMVGLGWDRLNSKFWFTVLNRQW